MLEVDTEVTIELEELVVEVEVIRAEEDEEEDDDVEGEALDEEEVDGTGREEVVTTLDAVEDLLERAT